jgi:O-acetyl-ADP-ribose deacetylase (regulator of RNase III)
MSNIKIIKQDLLQVEDGIICHQTNCMGAAGGLAGAIFRKYPEAYKVYKNNVQSFLDDWMPLGTIDLTKVKKDLYVANMYAQYDYGTDSRKTEYGTFRMCLRDLIHAIEFKSKSEDILKEIYFPYEIGCGLGGGNWEIVMGIIKYEFADWNYKVFICQHI